MGNNDINLYAFPKGNTTTRLRRVERTVPYLVRGNPAFSVSSTQTVINNAVSSSGIVDLTANGVLKRGSVPPAGVTGQFAATGTTSSITWYWDGTNGSVAMVINRADGTYQSVPGGSLTVSGLSANTTYYFLPFWSVSANRLGWVIGTTGSPKVAFVAADITSSSAQTYLCLQQLQNREQLTAGWMSYTTPVSGTNSGDGGGGGRPGSCVIEGTNIEPIGDYGDIEQERIAWYHWRTIYTQNAFQVTGTPDHPVYGCYEDERPKLEKALEVMTEESLSPFKVCLGDIELDNHWVVTKSGLSVVNFYNPWTSWKTKVCTHLKNGHLYWANGILSHNKVLPP